MSDRTFFSLRLNVVEGVVDVEVRSTSGPRRDFCPGVRVVTGEGDVSTERDRGRRPVVVVCMTLRVGICTLNEMYSIDQETF